MDDLADSPENWLVAHRGDRGGGTENTLSAFENAVRAGARFAECDIQFTGDMIPVILHDNWLKRLCHNPAAKTISLDLAVLRETCAPYFTLLTLEQLVTWLQQQPGLTLFIEIKATVRRRTTDRSIAKRLAGYILPTMLERIVLISKSGDILDACKTVFDSRLRIGWVAEGNSPPASQIDYIFMPHEAAEMIPRWQGKGVKIGLYTIDSAPVARQMRMLGADLIETDYFAQLLTELETDHGGH